MSQNMVDDVIDLALSGPASDSGIASRNSSKEIKSKRYPYFDKSNEPETEEIHSTTTAALLHYNALVSSQNDMESVSESEATTAAHKEYVSDVKLVQYDPSEKPQRLGRPRKHLGTKSIEVEDSSSENYNQSVISKFRLDSKPLEGPGSRGGVKSRIDPKGKVTSSILRKRKQQSVLNFSVDRSKSVKSNEISSTESLTDGEEIHNDNKPDKTDITSKVIANEQTPPKPEKPQISSVEASEETTKTSANMEKKARTYKRRAISNLNMLRTSRTTFVTNSQKTTRQLPGPLIPVNYAVYDGNVLQAQQNEKSAAEKIALGFPVKQSPYATHIVFIISFLNKFKSVVEISGIGPQSIEKGLGLDSSVDEDDSDKSVIISDEMNELFLRLMGLILNRKKPITSHSKAIAELKPLVNSLGLPKEWKSQVTDDVELHEAPLSPVDGQHPSIHFDTTFTTFEEEIIYNPFLVPDFETNGLSGIPIPINRLLLLKTLVQWTLTSSEAIKIFISNSVMKQDVPGDKDTYYGSRSILKGFKNTEVIKKEAESKLAKRKSSEEEAKYVDPTSNPLDHSLNLRIVEELCGDIGFHIGRFYLCRMADESNGGLSSIKKMRSVWSGNAASNRLPSDFKVYVQDTYQMLADYLSSTGIEFDDKGNEIKSNSQLFKSDAQWYEVASNGTELTKFVDYLANRLGVNSSERDESFIPMTSMIYKPTLYLYEYLDNMLPLIIKQETMPPEVQLSDKRSSRKQAINYSDKAASHLYEEYIEGDEFIDGGAHEDDDYEDSDGEELEPMDEDEDEDIDYED